ncbi:MAG TPA: TPM domain-containing protein [Bacteroidales bacterium]|nr:TPM domain-containing protein [Bacteroidales bacterium]
MRNYLLLTIMVSLVSFSCDNNKQNVSPVFDFEDILTIKQKRKLSGIISDYEKKTANQIIILTSKDLEGFENAVQYADIFGKEQGIFSIGKKNGLVIFVSDSLKQTSIATGYGTYRSLNDQITKEIVDSCMIPYFRVEKYYEGLKAGVEESIKNWK